MEKKFKSRREAIKTEVFFQFFDEKNLLIAISQFSLSPTLTVTHPGHLWTAGGAIRHQAQPEAAYVDLAVAVRGVALR